MLLHHLQRDARINEVIDRQDTACQRTCSRRDAIRDVEPADLTQALPWETEDNGEITAPKILSH